MSTLVATRDPPPGGYPPGTDVGGAKFVGPVEKFWMLLIRGGLLLVVTLGIYRFWLTTDIRRYLWSNTEIAGDTLEYLGTGRELLIGFLIAIAILVPIYAGFFIGALGLGTVGQIAYLLSFAFLAVLGQFAIYRARRYRLTRTMFRGLRFHQTGSGWRYAFCAIFWGTVSVLTLGLSYPWGQASLERYKMRHTFYGDLQGRFEGSGTRLFGRGLLLWVVVVVPILAAIVIAVTSIDWNEVADAFKGGTPDLGKLEGANPALAFAMMMPAFAAMWSVLAAVVLYPAFQGIMLKWWLQGLRFGDITVTTRLRKRRVYGVYFRFLWHALAFGVVALILVSVLAVAGGLTMSSLGSSAGFGKSTGFQIAVTILIVVLYALTLLGFSTIYQATVRLGLWRLGFESADLHGISALERVKAVPQSASAVGEGLADALDVGSF
jgi:uncharacterized membrane protein YjgN (DUF898 family)